MNDSINECSERIIGRGKKGRKERRKGRKEEGRKRGREGEREKERKEGRKKKRLYKTIPGNWLQL